MNRKGFTLIELLAVIVIIGILGVLIVPSLLNNITTAKEASYNILIKNIVTSSQLYYEESEYGDLTDTSKYGKYACNTNQEKKDEYECYMDKINKTITTTLGALANTGFLKVDDTKKLEEGTEIKVVLNPVNDNDISSCIINIKKVVNEQTDINGIKNYRVSYDVISSSDNCPTTEEYKGVQ